MDQFKNIFKKMFGGNQEAPQTLAGTAEEVGDKLAEAGTNALNQISVMEEAILDLVTSPIVIAFAIGLLVGCLANLIFGWTTKYQVANQNGNDTNPDQTHGSSLANLIRGWTTTFHVTNQNGAEKKNGADTNPDQTNGSSLANLIRGWTQKHQVANQAVAATKPNQATASHDPNQNVVASNPNQATASQDPNQNVADANPNLATASQDPNQNVADANPNKATASQDPNLNVAAPTADQECNQECN